MAVGREPVGERVLAHAPLHARRPARSTEELLREQETLRAFVESISSELDLEPLLGRILRHACELIGADDGAIGLVEPETGVVQTRAIYRMPDEELDALYPPGVGLAGQVLASGRPILLDRYADLEAPGRRYHGENAVLGFPISVRERMIGFIGIGRCPAPTPEDGPRRRPFDASDVETLGIFARHAGIAIDNARRYQRELERRESMALLTRVGQIITTELDLDEILQNAADAIHEVLGYPNVAIPTLEPGEPPVLAIAHVGGSYKSLLPRVYRQPVTQGIMGAAATERRAILVNDVESDPRWVHTPGSQGIRAELAIPIVIGDAVVGVLNVEGGDPFTEEDVESLKVVAGQLAVAIVNARLHKQARDLAVLAERQRLARDLHDSVTQLLFGTVMIAESLANAWKRDKDEGERRTERMLELARAALGEMRALLAELKPADATPPPPSDGGPQFGAALLRDGGLASALAEAIPNFGGPNVTLAFHAEGYEAQEHGLERALFRVAQEAVSNALRHARPSRVEVRLGRSGDDVFLSVLDDGTGMPEGLAERCRDPEQGGHGLRNMRERLAEYGGLLVITAGPSGGTCVRALAPARPAADGDDGAGGMAQQAGGTP
ncbi:MAG: GAF domain-containing sensor histidine kinase [Gemmatimonadota bacterium]